jgi:GTP-binding protein
LAGTKSDKLKPTKLAESIQTINDKLSETWEELPKFFITSSETSAGREELLDFISQCFTSK